MSISLQKYRGATSLAIVCTMVFVAALSFATFSHVEAQVSQNPVLLNNDDSSNESRDSSGSSVSESEDESGNENL